MGASYVVTWPDSGESLVRVHADEHGRARLFLVGRREPLLGLIEHRTVAAMEGDLRRIAHQHAAELRPVPESE
jgi:hypothetical protein